MRDFLAIEKVRFGARLSVECEIDDEARACLLPPMILQPLVENAVKHGIGNLTGGGWCASPRGATVRCCASASRTTSTRTRPRDSRAPGIGLANVRQRLATAYGHEGERPPGAPR